jgi:hypothetical protein
MLASMTGWRHASGAETGVADDLEGTIHKGMKNGGQ